MEDLKFTGNFYYCGSHEDAPNPCLFVKGLGIGLPLSDRDAKAIATHRPRKSASGIPARDVAFQNPKWQSWVEGIVFRGACDALGVAGKSGMMRCELAKLVLYEPDTKPDVSVDKPSIKSFATVMVSLPATCVGELLHLSHSGSKNTVEISKDSTTATRVTVWYNSVKANLGAIQSGHHLVLLYNLIHTDPNTPVPSLPDDITNTFACLGSVLEDWICYPDDCIPSARFFAFVLDHGPQLHGAGLSKLLRVHHLADAMGFAVALGKLEVHTRGTCDYPRRYYHPEGGAGEADLEQVPTMEDVEEARYTLSGVINPFDSNGKSFNGTHELDPGALIPDDWLEKASFDEQRYDKHGYSNERRIDYWYRRSVMILYNKEDEAEVNLDFNGGVGWGVTQLSSKSKGKQEDKTMAETMLRAIQRRAKRDPLEPTEPIDRWAGSESHSLNQKAAIAVLHCGAKWKDLALWKRAIQQLKCVWDDCKDGVVEGLKVFPFNSIKPTLENIYQSNNYGAVRQEIIACVVKHGDQKTATQTWIASRSTQIWENVACDLGLNSKSDLGPDSKASSSTKAPVGKDSKGKKRKAESLTAEFEGLGSESKKKKRKVADRL